MIERDALAARVNAALRRAPRVREKRMFGGITFMVNGKMCISVGARGLMCRIDPESHDAAIARRGVRTVRMKDEPIADSCMCGQMRSGRRRLSTTGCGRVSPSIDAPSPRGDA